MTVPAIGMARELGTIPPRGWAAACAAAMERARGYARAPMPLRRLQPGERLRPARGTAVVCIPVFGARELFEQCLRSVVQHTPEGTQVLVADDASPDAGIEAFAAAIADEPGTAVELAFLRQPANLGFVRNMNAAFAATAPADVVILNSDVVVPAGWLERLASPPSATRSWRPRAR